MVWIRTFLSGSGPDFGNKAHNWIYKNKFIFPQCASNGSESPNHFAGSDPDPTSYMK